MTKSAAMDMDRVSSLVKQGEGQESEIWGRGTNRITEQCKRHGAVPPTFNERQGFVIATFKADCVPGSAEDGEKAVETAVENTVEKIPHLIRSNPRVFQKEIASQTGLSRRGVQRNLSKMKKGKDQTHRPRPGWSLGDGGVTTQRTGQ